METTLDLAFNDDSKDQKKGFIDVLQTERFQEGLRNLGYVQAEGETTKELEEKIENAYKDLFERFGKEVEVGFYKAEELDNNDLSYIQKLTDSGFVGDDGKIWINKTIIDSGKPLELNSVFDHEGVHVVKGSNSELLAEFGESRGREFIQEAIKNGSIKVETVGVSDWGNNTLTVAEKEKLNATQGLQDRLYLDPSLSEVQRNKILNILQENVDHKLEIIELNGKYQVVIAKGGKSDNSENYGNIQLEKIIENDFDNLLTIYKEDTPTFKSSIFTQLGEVSSVVYPVEMYGIAMKIDDDLYKYSLLSSKKRDGSITSLELQEIEILLARIGPEMDKMIEITKKTYDGTGTGSIILFELEGKPRLNVYDKDKTSSSLQITNDPIAIGHEAEHILQTNEGRKPVLRNKEGELILDINNNTIPVRGDNFFYNSSGKLVYEYEALTNDSGKRVINVTPDKLKNISDSLTNDLRNGLYIKNSEYLDDSSKKNELLNILGENNVSKIEEHISKAPTGYEVKLELDSSMGKIDKINIYLLVGQKLIELEAVEAENKIRENARKNDADNPTLQERASYMPKGR